MRHLLYFTADWCHPCKRTRPVVEDLNRDGVIKVQFIDVDTEVDLVATYEIKSVPTFILIEDNKEIKRMNGAKTKEDFDIFLA
jgi:thiol-disulfide isomerase/thioredoxin